MPAFYTRGEYDLAGFAVGAVERSQLLPRTSEIVPGDVLIGLPSSGVHSNGFSLIRKILEFTGRSLKDQAPFGVSGRTIGEELLIPTKIYTKSMVPALKTGTVKAFAHITGGGLTENIPRILPEGTRVVMDADNWNILPVFGWLAVAGGISEAEMLKTFNCGLGGVIVCDKKNQETILETLKGENAVVVGDVQKLESGGNRVVVEHFGRSLDAEMSKHVPMCMEKIEDAIRRRWEKPVKKVGVLISGSGTNLQALIDATKDPFQEIPAQIAVVVSNKAGVEGLKRAESTGTPTKVRKGKNFVFIGDKYTENTYGKIL